MPPEEETEPFAPAPTVTPVHHSRLKLMACPEQHPCASVIIHPGTSPCLWIVLGLAAIYNVKGHWVAQKQLLQLTQMWDWLWRDRTKMFWCMKDEPYLDLLSECINDVCVQRKSALQHKAKHNKPANLFSNSQYIKSE